MEWLLGVQRVLGGYVESAHRVCVGCMDCAQMVHEGVQNFCYVHEGAHGVVHRGCMEGYRMVARCVEGGPWTGC